MLRFCCALVVLLSLSAGITAQKLIPAPEDMRHNLAEASRTQTLESAGTPSFHLEAKFETFDYLGKPDGDGTLVEDWLRPGVQRRVITFRGVTLTQTSRDGVVRSSGNSFDSSFIEVRVIDALLMPGPTLERLNEVTASYKQITAGKITMDCVILAPVDVVAKSDGAEKLPSAYCISPNPRLIRLTEERYALVLTYNRFARIGDHLVAEDVSISQNGKPRAAIHVTNFRTAPSLKEGDFYLPPSTDTSNEEVVTVLGGVQAGRILNKPGPRYPDEAKYAHISGTVVLDAKIDKTGIVRKLEVISTPAPSLAQASIDAVKQWKYAPYLLNGEPVEVDTTITVNFSFTR